MHNTGALAPCAEIRAALEFRKPGPGTTEYTPSRPVACA
jgi:hypothetical protein